MNLNLIFYLIGALTSVILLIIILYFYHRKQRVDEAALYLYDMIHKIIEYYNDATKEEQEKLQNIFLKIYDERISIDLEKISKHFADWDWKL